jgi:hypothetical protein
MTATPPSSKTAARTFYHECPDHFPAVPFMTNYRAGHLQAERRLADPRAMIELNANQGDSVFVQTNGTASAQTFLRAQPRWFGSFNDYITMGGRLVDLFELHPR